MFQHIILREVLSMSTKFDITDTDVFAVMFLLIYLYVLRYPVGE